MSTTREPAAERIGVVGATGALGTEIVKVLDRSRWRPRVLVPLASTATSVSHVPWGDEQVAVDDASTEALATLDAVILAAPVEVSRGLLFRAAEGDVSVVDCSGASYEDAPLLVPWVNPEVGSELRTGQVVAVPHPVATLLASALGPLARAGITGRASAVVLLPASQGGRTGIEELSRQVIALFSADTPPRKVFQHGLAFDLIPQWGPTQAGGWTELEAAAAVQTAQLAGGASCAITVVGVPVFSGVSAHLTLQPSRAVHPELVARILSDGGVQVELESEARTLPRPRRVEGHPLVHGGRIRVDASGALHIWLAMDNLAVTAAIAVACCGLLLRAAQ